jgi:hypothetical protein
MRKTRKTNKKSCKKRTNIKKGGVNLQKTLKSMAYKTTNSVKYVNRKPKKIINVPRLVIPEDDNDVHIYLNLLIDLMGSSLYDAFIDNINKLYNLNINLIPCRLNVKETATKYVIKNDLPAIFYGYGKDSTHFICTYNKSFDMCKNKIPLSTIQSTRSIRNPCENLKNCLWDPYENGGDNCTIYAGFQKAQAHSFCQTFTLSCMVNQYLPDLELISDFKNMTSVNDIANPITKNEILIMNAFYAKNIACKIVRYAFQNNLSINDDYFWDFLYEQIKEDNYITSQEVDSNNYNDFMNSFLAFCENITIDQFKNSTIITNIIY